MRPPADPPPTGAATKLLQRLDDGEPQASDQLVALLYGELRALASGQMRRERSDRCH
jgi:hypothetical protein